MTLADQAALAVDPQWTPRCRMAVVSAALQIKGEARQRGFGPYYEKRTALADQVLGSPPSSAYGTQGLVPMPTSQVMDRFCWAVAANSTITSQSNDGDLFGAVAMVWDDLSGVNDEDRPA